VTDVTHHRLVDVVLRLRAEGSPVAAGDADEIARLAFRRWLRSALLDGHHAARERRVEDLARRLSEAVAAHPPPPFAEYHYLASRLAEVLPDSA
jgi:hypothetical protein